MIEPSGRRYIEVVRVDSSDDKELKELLRRVYLRQERDAKTLDDDMNKVLSDNILDLF